MPVSTDIAIPGEWPGVEARWTGNGLYLNVTVRDGASWPAVVAALKAAAIGLELYNVSNAGELIFKRGLAWRSVADAV